MSKEETLLVVTKPPVVVFVSEKETTEDGWGFVQFPTLSRLVNGNMLLSFQFAEDSAASYGQDGYRYYISKDNS